jgi:hypothetical protein
MSTRLAMQQAQSASLWRSVSVQTSVLQLYCRGLTYPLWTRFVFVAYQIARGETKTTLAFLPAGHQSNRPYLGQDRLGQFLLVYFDGHLAAGDAMCVHFDEACSKERIDRLDPVCACLPCGDVSHSLPQLSQLQDAHVSKPSNGSHVTRTGAMQLCMLYFLFILCGEIISFLSR